MFHVEKKNALYDVHHQSRAQFIYYKYLSSNFIFFQIFNSANNLAFPNSPNSRLWMDPDSSLFFIAIIIYT